MTSWIGRAWDAIRTRRESAWVRIKATVAYWKEVPWTVVLIGGVVAAYYAIPRIDPQSGIDGFGDWFAVGVKVLIGMVVAFSAWFCNDHYMLDLDDEREMQLLDKATKKWEALCALIVQRLCFFGWLFFWWYLVSH